MSKATEFIQKYIYLPLCYLKTYILLVVGQIFGYLLIETLAYVLTKKVPSFVSSDVWQTASMYLDFIGIWIILGLYLLLRKRERPIISAISTKCRGNRPLQFFMGVALGFSLNFICALFAMFNKDIAISYKQFNLGSALFIFIAVLIQSGAEEIICRGYLYHLLLRKYKKPWVAIVFNSILFALLHLGNPSVSIISLVSIFMAGVLPSLMMYYFDSLWMCIGEHLMWNYTQNIILGLPNSGLVVPYSFFELNTANARSSFFYDVGFGIEGSLFSILILILTCGVILYFNKGKHKENYDIWENQIDEELINNSTENYETTEEAVYASLEKQFQKEVSNANSKGITDAESYAIEKILKSADSTELFSLILPWGFLVGAIILILIEKRVGFFSIFLLVEFLLFFTTKKAMKEGIKLRRQWAEEKKKLISQTSNCENN